MRRAATGRRARGGLLQELHEGLTAPLGSVPLGLLFRNSLGTVLSPMGVNPERFRARASVRQSSCLRDTAAPLLPGLRSLRPGAARGRLCAPSGMWVLDPLQPAQVVVGFTGLRARTCENK